MTIKRFLAASAVLAFAQPAGAQVPPDIAEKTRALGQTMNPAEGYSPWEGRFDQTLFQQMTITRALAYGGDPAHQLDVYIGDGAAAPRPVLVFVHGGGFVGGRRDGQPYPDNVAAWAAREGMVGVSIDYRLAPTFTWPAGASDLALAIQWIRGNIGRYGGDPQRIVLFGHSAGANHVADYVAHPDLRGAEFSGVKGAILLSPNYPDSVTDGADPHVYYGTDASLQTFASQVDNLRSSGLPLFIGNAQFDPDVMQHFAEKARDKLCEAADSCPGYVRLADHNHFTEGLSLGTADRSLSAPLLDWMRKIGVLQRGAELARSAVRDHR